MAEKVRIDKWLWSVRIFKSRTLAGDMIKTNKVKVNGKEVKASFLIQRNDTIVVEKGGFNFTFKVLDLIEKRVGSPIALTCYQDMTPPEELNKYNDGSHEIILRYQFQKKSLQIRSPRFY